jgi:hypothetical protein
MFSLPIIPFDNTPMSMTASSVTKAVIGAPLKLVQADGARLKPMMATTAPFTTGGISISIHFAPAKWTISPTTASSAR